MRNLDALPVYTVITKSFHLFPSMFIQSPSQSTRSFIKYHTKRADSQQQRSTNIECVAIVEIWNIF